MCFGGSDVMEQNHNSRGLALQREERSETMELKDAEGGEGEFGDLWK